MRISGQVHRLSKTKMEQAGDAGCAAVSSSSNGDQGDPARKRMKLAVVKDAKKSGRPKDAVPALKLPASGKKRAAKRKRSDEEDGDANEAKTEMDAARALMGILNFGVIPSPIKSKGSVAMPLPLSWLSTRRRSDRARKAEGMGTSEDASSSQPGKSLSTAPAGKCEDGCQSDNERNDKRVMRLNSSDSSTEFALPDSRAQSPSSPLPPLAGEACFSIIAKMESQDAAGPLFQRSAPLRPVKKAPLVRKPKIDGKNVSVNAVKNDEVLRQVGKKKVRQPRRQGSAAAAKVELSSSGTLSAASLKDVSGQPAEPEVNRSEQQASKALCVKEETKGELAIGVPKATERSGVKSRPVLSEIEKESRRLRRVQANRESARQTIRKKQLHCEELAHKAAELVSERDVLKQDYNQKLKEFQQLFETKRQLKEELAACTGQKEPSPVKMSSIDQPVPPSSTLPFQFSMLPPPGLMHPFLWSAFAAAMAQEAVKNMVHPHVLSMPAALSAGAMQYTVTSASPDKMSTAPMPAIGQHSLARQRSSEANSPPPAGSGADKVPPSSSKTGGITGESAMASMPDMKEIVSRPLNSSFPGKASSIGGKASFMGLSSPFPLGVPGMSMPSLIGSDAVPGALGSSMPFAFGPGHSANRVAGGLRNSQVAGKLIGMRGPMHGGHYFFDSPQQQAMPMLSAAKPSGAAAAAAAARKRRKELTRSRNIFNRHLARSTSTEVVVPPAVS